jgi:DNA repair photolyase
MTVDDTLGRRFEPRASTPSQRLEALRALHDSGLHTRAFVSPYLPGLSDIDVLIDALDGAVDEIGVEAFNPRGSNWTGVAEILARYYPHLLPGYRERVKADEPWQALEAKSRRLAAQHDINFVGFYRHN